MLRRMKKENCYNRKKSSIGSYNQDGKQESQKD